MVNKKQYGVDTVALLAYFGNMLGTKSNQIFQEAEELKAELIIPEIVIGETICTIRRGKEIFGKKIPKDLLETIITTLFHSPMYKIMDIKMIGWEWFLRSSIPELHDRMIVATCIQERTSILITTDEELGRISEISTLW